MNFMISQNTRGHLRYLATLMTVLILGSLPSLHAVDDLNGWHQDIALYRTELPARHINLFFHTTREAFNHELDLLETDLPDLSELDACLRLERITIGIGDDHTSITLPRKITDDLISLPLNVGWFEDGIFVLGVEQRFKPALATRIVAVGATPIDQAMAKLAPIISTANPMTLKHRAPRKFSILNYWQQVGLAEPNGSLKLTCMDRDQQSYTFELKPLDGLDEYKPQAQKIKVGAKACPTSQPITPFFSITKLDAGKTLHAQYNKCGGREIEERHGKSKEAVANLPSIYDFFDQLLNELRSGEIEKLIFDLRWNSGGVSDPGSEFVDELAKLEAINQRGKIFVLIGRRTFSSALLNAADFKEHTQAILVGEPTSGNASHFGEVRTFELPHTHINVYYSTKYFRRDGGNEGALVPDIAAAQTFKDFVNGIDPAIEAALHYRTDSSISPDLIRSAVANP
jgi:hypothetical protein